MSKDTGIINKFVMKELKIYSFQIEYVKKTIYISNNA